MTYRASIHQRGHQNKNVGHHLPEGKQTGPRHIPPRAASALRLPGKGATRVPIIARAAAPFQVPSRTWRRCPRLGDRRPAGARERPRAPGRCLGAKGSDLVSQQSLFVTATRLEAKAAGQPGQGPERRRRGRRWEESARGQGGRRQGPGGWTYSCHNCGDEGLRNRFFQKQTENGRMKIQPTSLDRDLLQSISGRRPDHMGTAKSQANSSAAHIQ
uniref:Uncharacterized protein LOC112823570 n=1 Tax=Callorhinus ursinus TaxID=34884 RepID=A0A3Q7P0H1_CALUR|nr:uncharacterized protein LOC112823570 [Callorhinus ursinus]